MLEGKCVFGGTADSRHLKRGKEPKQYTAFFVKGVTIQKGWEVGFSSALDFPCHHW